MKNIRKNLKKVAALTVMLIMFAGSACFAEEGNTIVGALKGGKISGTIGNYYEYVSREADNSDSGWSSTYITMKYETLKWNNLKFGARFWFHGKVYSYDEDGVTDAFDADIETDFTLPEMYLNYSFLENSSATAGRWNHKKVSHIDDSQSEGGYVSFKEIENLELIVGCMTRFAEIDYDDGEDFGRTNDAQRLDSENVYGAGSSAYLVYGEAKYKPIDTLKLNPFFMYHNNYAGVFGIEASFKDEWEEHEVSYGTKILYENINAYIDGSDDANVFVITPFIKKGPIGLEVAYNRFSDGDALNKPGWLRDPNNLVDQDVADGNPGAEIVEARIKYSLDKFWASYAFGTASYDTSATKGDGYTGNEFQIGYKFTDNLDANVRYFIVKFDSIDDRDYNKVESRVRFKF